MKTALAELIRLVSSGCLAEQEILRIADEAAQAYTDADAFLASNPDINYDDSFPIPLYCSRLTLTKSCFSRSSTPSVRM
jgi:hypothetical protein